MDYITKDILVEWGACEEGVELFCQHFEKATLSEIAEKCIELSEHENANWLYEKCRQLRIFEDTVSKGYCNSGYRNSGDCNSGDCNSGNQNSGDWNSGDCNSGNQNSGYRNSGDQNSGYRNSGNQNSGNQNSGYRNSGNQNSGDCNSGYRNSGDWNSGDCNSGNQNSGHWNSADNESGYFNSKNDETVRVFNSRVKRVDWDRCNKPEFIYSVKTTYWVSECEMSDEEKINDPDSNVRGGQLRKRGYKEAWKIAYESATEEDIELLKALPGFDAEVFEEITGIKV